LLSWLSEAAVVAGQLFEIAQGSAERDFSGGSAFVELLKAAGGCAVEFFSVGEDAFFGFQGFVFAGDELGLGDFLVLIAPEVDHAEAVLLALDEFVEVIGGLAPADVGFSDGVGGEAGEAVEEGALLGLVEAGEGFALGVDEGEFRGELLEDGDRGGLVVDEHSAFAVGLDFAPEDDFVAGGVDAVLLEDGVCASGGLEDAGDYGLVCAVADEVGGGFAAHEEGKRVNENGFACAGFAREEVEAGAELSDGVIDDGVVLSAQFDEHLGVQSPGTRMQLQSERSIA